jgi:glycosyltransferase involved in cell wall biosynthesis
MNGQSFTAHNGAAQIDVLLPYYGDVELMKIAVQSVLDQNYPHWRLVVVDDGYPDPEPARWFATITDPRVGYQRNTANLGANGNYRKCLSLVEAPTAVVLGADDVLLPNFLSTVFDAFRAFPDASVVQVGVQVIDENGRRIRPLGDRVKAHYTPCVTRPTAFTGERLAVGLLRGNWTYFPSLAWNSATITGIGFREGLHVTQDLALLLDVVRGGGSLVLDPTIAFCYRRHSASDSSVKAADGRRFDEERALFRTEAEAFAASGWKRAGRAARWHVSSRLNALSLLPSAIRTCRAANVRAIGRHIIG